MIVVAGANGNLGLHVAAALRARGTPVRALVRSRRRALAAGLPPDEIMVVDFSDPAALARALHDAAGVISCLGASVAPRVGAGFRGYNQVDRPLNAALIHAAQRTGVGMFVYVSACGAPQLRHLAYFNAHAAVEDLLKASSLGWAIVRPTGLFSAFAPLHKLARRGFAPVVDDGAARTNPIAERDAATACLKAFNLPGAERNVGGPDILSRRDIAALALAAQTAKGVVRSIPSKLLAAQAAAIRPLHPRLSDLLRFVGHVMTHDTIAPPVGEHRLAEYFASLNAPGDATGTPSTPENDTPPEARPR